MEGESVRIDKLKNVENWGTWKFQVKVLLVANESWDVVTGESLKPQPPRGNDAAILAEHIKEVKKWIKRDGTAQKTIVTTVSNQPLLHIINCSTSKEMWDKLHQVYENKNQASVHMLQRQWYTLEKDPLDGIAAHIARIEALGHRLSVMGEPISEGMIMTKILMTLPTSYQHFSAAWDSTREEDKTLANLASRLTIEEFKMVSQEKQDDSAFASKTSHDKRVKAKSDSKKIFKKTGKCFKCGKEGHWKNECKKKSNNVSQSHSQSEGRGEALIGESFVVTITEGENTVNSWYMDSGASQHMTSRKD